MMMRATLILAGIGTLTVMEIQTPPRAKNTVSGPPQISILARGESDGSLPKGDRLEIPSAQSAQPFSSLVGTTSTHVTALVSIVKQPKSIAIEKKGVVHTDRPRPKAPKPKVIAKTDPSKEFIESKRCRPNGFDGLLKALDLPYRCES